jgi:hypothetical protein
MGRTSQDLDGDATEAIVRPIMPNPYEDAYDAGGAYWGLGNQVWRIETDAGNVAYFRAATRHDAREEARERLPDVSLDVWRDVGTMPEEHAREAILNGREY